MPVLPGAPRQKSKVRHRPQNWPACALADARAEREGWADAPRSKRERHWPPGGSHARTPLHLWPATAWEMRRRRSAGAPGNRGDLLLH